MAHYAFINDRNYVTEVIEGRDENELPEGIVSWETYYGTLRGMTCIETSYTGAFRGKYAGIGDLWNDTEFTPPPPPPEPVDDFVA